LLNKSNTNRSSRVWASVGNIDVLVSGAVSYRNKCFTCHERAAEVKLLSQGAGICPLSFSIPGNILNVLGPTFTFSYSSDA